MVTQQSPSRSRGFLKPVIGALIVIAAIIAGIYFRDEVGRAVRWLSRVTNNWLTDWVPAHRGETLAIVGFAVLAFLINWVAHVRGRLRAWIFALVLEIGLWLLFWYGLLIPPLNELAGLDIPRMTTEAIILSGVVVVAITGALFWFLEMREEWRKYRRRHTVDEG